MFGYCIINVIKCSSGGGSYIYSPDWIKKKKKILSIKNKCFQYAVTIILNYEEIKRDPQRTTKLNLEGITGKE